MPSIQEKITDFILQKFKKFLFYLVSAGVFFAGYSLYQWYDKKSADWHTATLYFNDNQPPYTGEFAFENGKIVQEKRYKDCTTKKTENIAKPPILFMFPKKARSFLPIK